MQVVKIAADLKGTQGRIGAGEGDSAVNSPRRTATARACARARARARARAQRMITILNWRREKRIYPPIPLAYRAATRFGARAYRKDPLPLRDPHRDSGK
jgi:uncharacterized protein YggE